MTVHTILDICQYTQKTQMMDVNLKLIKSVIKSFILYNISKTNFVPTTIYIEECFDPEFFYLECMDKANWLYMYMFPY